MARPSDKEYALQRKIKDLEAKVHQQDQEIARLKKQLEKSEPLENRKKSPIKIEKGCPDCEAPIKESPLPHATLRLCSKACGWREVKK